MTEQQRFLKLLIQQTKHTKFRLVQGSSLANTHSLRCFLQHRLPEYDLLETQLLALAERRSWEISSQFRLHFGPFFHSQHSDAQLTEHMIRHFSDQRIRVLQASHRLGLPDPMTEDLLQKFLDAHFISIRQLEGFL